jgi:hypothetical protein
MLLTALGAAASLGFCGFVVSFGITGHPGLATFLQWDCALGVIAACGLAFVAVTAPGKAR